MSATEQCARCHRETPLAAIVFIAHGLEGNLCFARVCLVCAGLASPDSWFPSDTALILRYLDRRIKATDNFSAREATIVRETLERVRDYITRQMPEEKNDPGHLQMWREQRDEGLYFTEVDEQGR